MHLDELEWFVVLAETEHVTDAAAQLQVTQPTLSRALARWEAQLGAPLFDRVNRRLRLNAYGEILADHARRACAEMRAATERIEALRNPDTGVVRLAFLHSLASRFVPDLLRQFREQAPGVAFELFQGGGHDVVERIRAGRADVAITSPEPAGPAGFAPAWHLLHSERLAVAVPPAHPLRERDGVRMTEFAAEPLVGLRPEFGLRQLTDELCATAGISPRIVFEATEIPTMLGLVAAGFGVAVVPEAQPGAGDPAVILLALTDPGAHREIGLTWDTGRPLPPSAARFAAFAENAAGG